MATKTHPLDAMVNSTPRLAADMVEAMKRYQDLGHDIELLREHLRSPHPRPRVDARIAACMLRRTTRFRSIVRARRSSGSCKSTALTNSLPRLTISRGSCRSSSR